MSKEGSVSTEHLRSAPHLQSAKLGQTETGYWGEGWLFIAGLFKSRTWSHTLWLYWWIGVSVIGMMILFRRFSVEGGIPRQMTVILLWGVLYVVAYGVLLNPPDYPWYYTPFSLFLAVPLAYFTSAVFGVIVRQFPERHKTVAICALLIMAWVSTLVHVQVSPARYNGK